MIPLVKTSTKIAIIAKALKGAHSLADGVLFDHLYPLGIQEWPLALVSSIVSGVGVFQFMALLLVLAYFRKRRRGAAIVRSWDDEEDEDMLLFPSDLEGREPPYPWEDEEE